MWIWLIIAAAAVFVIGVVLYFSGRSAARQRTAALRRHFGEEYDKVIADLGGRRQGEAELRDRLRRRRNLEVRGLDSAERDRFGSAWASVQAAFVDTPVNGLREADLLVMQVMRDRGYPAEQFEERAQVFSVDHPELVEHFRSAHRVAIANEEGMVDTEQLRQAMVSYRYVFDELLQGGELKQIPRL